MDHVFLSRGEVPAGGLEDDLLLPALNSQVVIGPNT